MTNNFSQVIDHSHDRLDSRLAHLEKRTKEQVFHLNQTMKESFAQERGECLDRMDRRALRERIAIERQQLVSVLYKEINDRLRELALTQPRCCRTSPLPNFRT